MDLNKGWWVIFSRSCGYVIVSLGVSAPIVGTTSLENLKDIIGKWWSSIWRIFYPLTSISWNRREAHTGGNQISWGRVQTHCCDWSLLSSWRYISSDRRLLVLINQFACFKLFQKLWTIYILQQVILTRCHWKTSRNTQADQLRGDKDSVRSGWFLNVANCQWRPRLSVWKIRVGTYNK